MTVVILGLFPHPLGLGVKGDLGVGPSLMTWGQLPHSLIVRVVGPARGIGLVYCYKGG